MRALELRHSETSSCDYPGRLSRSRKLRTPQSLETYRSPLRIMGESRSRGSLGSVDADPSRFVHVALCPHLGRTSRRRRAPASSELASCNSRMKSRHGLGSPDRPKIPLMNRPGLFAASESSRVYVTAVFVALLAFFEIKTRPVFVAAHNVPVSLGARATAATAQPAPEHGTTCSAVIRSGRCQDRRASRADADEVAAGGVRTRGRKFRAVRFQECLICRPNPESARHSDEPWKIVPALTDWIGDDGRVKLCPFAVAAIGPLAMTHFVWVAILEVHIVEIPGERVEPERGVAHVKARLTAIAVDYLRPIRPSQRSQMCRCPACRPEHAWIVCSN